MTDMTTDLFAEYSYGQIALQKLAPTDPDFRLYKAGWMGKSNTRDAMQVTGGVFRKALRGQYKGKLAVLVADISRSVDVTASEMDAFEAPETTSSDPKPAV